MSLLLVLALLGLAGTVDIYHVVSRINKMNIRIAFYWQFVLVVVSQERLPWGTTRCASLTPDPGRSTCTAAECPAAEFSSTDGG